MERFGLHVLVVGIKCDEKGREEGESVCVREEIGLILDDFEAKMVLLRVWLYGTWSGVNMMIV
jgi:hypothetical protein